MALHSIISGLDVGTAKTVAAVAEVSPTGEIKIIGLGMAPTQGLHRETIVDIEAATNCISDALDEAEATSGFNIRELYVGLAGEDIVSLNATGVVGLNDHRRKNAEVEITEDDKDRVLDSARAVGLPQGRQIIHAIPQEFAVDGNRGIHNPVGMSGRRLEAQVHLVTISETGTKNLLNAIKHAHCRVRDFILEPLASAEAVLTAEEKEIGVALIDFGCATTDTVVFTSYGIQYSESLPFGSERITSDIAKLLHITEEQAEQLKINHGSCYPPETDVNRIFEVKGIGGRPDRNLNEAELAMYISARMEEILEMVRDNLARHGFLSRLGSGIVLTGGGSRLRGLKPLAENIFNVPVRLGIPENISPASPVKVNEPELATVVGLLVYAARNLALEPFVVSRSFWRDQFKRLGRFFKENFL